MAKLYEAGDYRAKAVKAVLGETSSGKEQVAVRFQLLDLPGEHITWYGYFTEKTIEHTFKGLRTAGWRGTDISDLSDLEQSATPEVMLVIETEKDDKGELRSKVRWVNSGDNIGVSKVLPDAKAKQFSNSLRAKLAVFDQRAKQGKSQAPKAAAKAQPAQEPEPEEAPAEAGDADDDIPF